LLNIKFTFINANPPSQLSFLTVMAAWFAQRGFTILPATSSDLEAIERMVITAYSKYIPRMGMKPAPMTADWASLVAANQVYVLRVDGTLHALGSIVLRNTEESIKVNSLVVDPASQGKGYGKVLMKFASDEGRKRGCKAVELYTHEKMVENVTLYEKMGFEEIGRRTEDGFDRVFFRKAIS
jgi:GNAT superfamily N-acetyltransferase